MRSDHSAHERSRDLVVFFVLAYVFSWLIGIPLALERQGFIPPILPEWVHYLYGYGPMLSALAVAGFSQGRQGLGDIWSRMVKWKVQPIWWAVALSPLLLGLVVALVFNLLGGGNISLSTLGEVKFLPGLGIGALFLWVFTFGLGEETGWRGYALPRLQYGRSAFRATAILWFFWALWHLPAFFYLYDPVIAPGWLVGQFAGAILFTWLFNSSSGSILIVAIWHGCFNFITSSQAGDGLLAAVVSTLVMVWAVVILVAFKLENLSSSERVAV